MKTIACLTETLLPSEHIICAQHMNQLKTILQTLQVNSKGQALLRGRVAWLWEA